MCTVSYISSDTGCIITSNRDEHTSRPIAFRPQEEIINNYKIIYPKDPKAGGTWFAIREDGVAVVLLNGAFQKHIPFGKYKMSRGLVLLEIISNKQPDDHFFNMDLTRIEPFTLILFKGTHLLEMRWDGKSKHEKTLDVNGNYIWSSVTLYGEKATQKREHLFNEFLKDKKWVNENSIVDFHMGHDNDFENGFVIDRSDGLKTVSITQAVFNEEEMGLSHIDLLNDTKTTATSCIKLYV
jgi:uncharacterized protein with NRDE domain